MFGWLSQKIGWLALLIVTGAGVVLTNIVGVYSKTGEALLAAVSLPLFLECLYLVNRRWNRSVASARRAWWLLAVFNVLLLLACLVVVVGAATVGVE